MKIADIWEPVRQRDGVYGVTIDERGHQVHTLISELDLAAVPMDATTRDMDVSKRQVAGNGEFWCGCGNPLVPSNCDAAVSNLERQLPTNGDTRIYNNYYAINGPVVAFVCIIGKYAADLTGGEVSAYYGQITAKCGRYISGTFEHAQEGTYFVGYMQYTPGLNFCDDATHSTHHSC